MMRVCPCCGGYDWEPFLALSSEHVLFTDQRVVAGRLSKVICPVCHVVANAKRLSDAKLREFYNEQYELNSARDEEHLFFTRAGPIPRSQVIYEWIAENLPRKVGSVVEVGCGTGNVLKRFRDRGAAAVGIEASRKAAELARAKGLSVRQEIILTSDHRLPPADLVYSYGVLEHVEDPALLLSAMSSAVAEHGMVMVGVPVQDEGSYDHLFADHVWHFTVDQVLRLLGRQGLRVKTIRAFHPINPGFALFLCEPNQAAGACELEEVSDSLLIHRGNRDRWLTILGSVDARLAELRNKRLIVYGSGEMLGLLMAYTALRDARIVACFDEDPAKQGIHKYGIPVIDPNSLSSDDADAVLLTTNPRYEALIREKLKFTTWPVISCLDQVDDQSRPASRTARPRPVPP